MIFVHYVCHDASVPGLEFRLWIGHSAFLFHVIEIEQNAFEASCLEFRVEESHEGRGHALPSTVSKDDDCLRIHLQSETPEGAAFRVEAA